MKKIIFLFITLLVLISAPAEVNAGFKTERLYDPFCLFTCDDKNNNENTSSVVNNINSNVNSTNSSVISGTAGATNPIVVYRDNTPIYNYNSYNDSYITNLIVSCYANPTSGNIGSSVNWSSSISGGNGNYYITWSGSDGFSATGNSVTKTYYSSGTKNASVTVTSGNQTITRNCSSIIIYDNNYDYSYNTNYNNGYYNNYYYNKYNNSNYYNSPLYVSCQTNSTFAPVGTNVVWQGNVSGGNGSYSYTWTGSDYLRGYNQSVGAIYNTPGVKTATLTVSSGNQSVTQQCTNSLTVGVPNYAYNQNNYTNGRSLVFNNGFQIACYPDSTSGKIGVPVTWSVEAIAPAGVYGNLTYNWSGTDGFTGYQQNSYATYSSIGTKTANVTVVASNGQRATQACGNSVYISNPLTASTYSKNTNSNVAANNSSVAKDSVASKSKDTNNNQTASIIFSLGNVQWGWVAVMMIIVLLFTILYMMFNRKKI